MHRSMPSCSASPQPGQVRGKSPPQRLQWPAPARFGISHEGHFIDAADPSTTGPTNQPAGSPGVKRAYDGGMKKLIWILLILIAGYLLWRWWSTGSAETADRGERLFYDRVWLDKLPRG